MQITVLSYALLFLICHFLSIFVHIDTYSYFWDVSFIHLWLLLVYFGGLEVEFRVGIVFLFQDNIDRCSARKKMATGSRSRFKMGRSSSVLEDAKPIGLSSPPPSEKPSRPGAFGVLGAKMRAYSSPRQRRVSSHSSSRGSGFGLGLDFRRNASSRTSLVPTEGELGVKKTNDYEIVPSPSASSSLALDHQPSVHNDDHVSSAASYKGTDLPQVDPAPTSVPGKAYPSLRSRKRPSISGGLGGLGGVVRRWSAVGSPPSISPRNEEDDPSTFNLHSFRRVAGPSTPSPGPLPLPQPISRAESFVSAVEFDPSSPPTSKPSSPNVVQQPQMEQSQQQQQQHHQHRLSGSSFFTGADTSTTSSPGRQSNPTTKMSAGRFRAGTAARSSRPDLTSLALFPEREQRPASPTSPSSGNVSPTMAVSGLPRSPGQELAELEAELARGRSTPLFRRATEQELSSSTMEGGAAARLSRPIVAKQGSFASLRDLEDGAGGDTARGYGLDSARVLASGTAGGPRTLIDAISQMERERNKNGTGIEPPRLPWMGDEGPSSNRSSSDTGERRFGMMSSSSSKDSGATVHPSLQPSAPVETGYSPSPSTVDSNFLASELQASPNHAIFAEDASPFRHSRAKSEGALLLSASEPRSEGRRSTHDNQNHAHSNGHAKRASYYGQSADTPWPTTSRGASLARRERSPPPPPLPSKTEELMMFHARQAPAMASKIQQEHWRIAWPTPPCVDRDWFARLTALQQHSLYETHRKAAGIARDEYLQIMSAAVPPSALIDPGDVFEAKLASNGNLQRSTSVAREPAATSTPLTTTKKLRRSSMPAISRLKQEAKSPPPLPSAPADALTVVTDDDEEFKTLERLLQGTSELHVTLLQKNLESE